MAQSSSSSALDVEKQYAEPQPDNSNQACSSDSQPANTPLLQEAKFLLLISFSQFIATASLAQAMVPISIISSSLDLSSSEASWPSAAFSLTVGTFVLLAGRVGDVYGHRRSFIVAWLWYSLWALLCGFAPFVPSNRGVYLSICRAFQGIGSAFLVPTSLALLGRRYKNGKRKDYAFAIFAAMAPIGFIAGAAFSSLFAQLVWWPWTFWAASVITLILSLCGWLLLPHDPASQLPRTIASIDLPGAVLGIVGLVLINIAFNQAPVVTWSSVQPPLFLVLSIFIFSAFLYHEHRTPHPLLPIRSLNAECSAVLDCVALGWSTLGTWIYYLFQFLQVLRGQTPLGATGQFCAEIISAVVAALTTGAVLSKVRADLLMVGSMLAFCIGCILAATMPVEETYWASTFVGMVVAAWG